MYREFKETVESLKKYKDLYEKNYGPLCLEETLYYDSYMWSKNPSKHKSLSSLTNLSPQFGRRRISSMTAWIIIAASPVAP